MALDKKLVAPFGRSYFGIWDPMSVATDPNWPSDSTTPNIPGVLDSANSGLTAETSRPTLTKSPTPYGEAPSSGSQGASSSVALLSLLQDGAPSFP